MAFEDAVTLAKCLRDDKDLPTAFASYERLRRDRVEKVVAQGKRNGDGKSLGPVMRLLLPLFVKQNLSWLHDHRIDWDAPSTVTP
jgi:2-polyprenyl-6-methoxyphenol hydroxylase-like FAD-dependent oxidoreductase